MSPQFRLVLAALSHLVKPGTQQPGDLLDQSVGGQEGVVLSSQLLHLLLVLVQLLQVVGGHAGQVLALGLVAVGLVSQDAHAELLAGNVLQPEGKFFSAEGARIVVSSRALILFQSLDR